MGQATWRAEWALWRAVLDVTASHHMRSGQSRCQLCAKSLCTVECEYLAVKTVAPVSVAFPCSKRVGTLRITSEVPSAVETRCKNVVIRTEACDVANNLHLLDGKCHSILSDVGLRQNRSDWATL